MQTRRIAALAILLVLVTFAVFSRVQQAEFVSWDDNEHVYQNPYFRLPASESLAYFWRHPYFNLYIPLTYSFWYALAQHADRPSSLAPPEAVASPLDPAVFHRASLVLHLLNVLLVFALLRLILSVAARNAEKNNGLANRKAGTASPAVVGSAIDIAAALGALFWGIHPVQVESVAWVSETRGLLCTFFSLAALWQYLGYALSGTEHPVLESPGAAKESQSGKRARMSRFYPARYISYFFAFLLFILALLSKPSAAGLPLVALVLQAGLATGVFDRQSEAPHRWRSLLNLAPWFLLAAGWVFLTRSVQPTGGSAILSTWWTRPLVAGDAFAFYCGKILWPLGLGVDYGRTPAFVMSHGWAFAMWLAPATLAVLLWRARRKYPLLVVAAGVFIAALLPVSGLVPFIFQIYSTVADRYLYLPLLGPAIALAWVVDRLLQSSSRYAKLLVGLCGLALLGLVPLTVATVANWKNTPALMEHAMQVNPRSWLANNQLGVYFLDRNRLTEAEKYLETSLKLSAHNELPFSNLAALRYRQGRTTEAETLYQRSLAINPNFSDALNSLGEIFLHQGRVADAINLYTRSLEISPLSSRAKRDMGVALATEKRFDEAIPYLEASLQFAPHNVEAIRNLGLAFFSTGDYEKALPYLRASLVNTLGDGDLLNSYGVALAREKRVLEAIPVLQRAVSAKPKDAEIRFNLGLALLIFGDKKSAAAQFRQALKFDPSYAPARAALRDALK